MFFFDRADVRPMRRRLSTGERAPCLCLGHVTLFSSHLSLTRSIALFIHSKPPSRSHSQPTLASRQDNYYFDPVREITGCWLDVRDDIKVAVERCGCNSAVGVAGSALWTMLRTGLALMLSIGGSALWTRLSDVHPGSPSFGLH